MASGVEIPEKTGQLLSFNADTSDTGIKITDHIERRQCWIETPHSVTPNEISTNEFYFPVDRSVSFFTDSLSLPYSLAAVIRNHSGLMIDELSKNDSKVFPVDEYSIELSAPIKLYIVVNSNFSISTSSEEVQISFGEPVDVYLGARSHHERPAAKIKTSKDPADIMESISYLSSAFKTMSCERSYPTLRGHPPEIEIAENFEKPTIVNKPETGVTIEVPLEYEAIFTMSPLIYYLGANVIPGDKPRIKTNNGFTYNLSSMDTDFESAVEKILKQCFFFDCISRTEGYYPVNLHERNQIADVVDLDYNSIYDEPLPEQLRKYLSIPYEDIREYVPQWKKTAYVECSPKNVEALPFLLHDLAIIRSDERVKIESNQSGSLGDENQKQGCKNINKFFRSNKKRKSDFYRASSESREFTRNNNEENTRLDEYVQVPETTSLEKVWIGSGIPIGANKTTTEAFHNRLDRSPIDDNIDITVIVNDEQMAEEGVIVDDIYGSREQLSFTVNVRQQLTTELLRDALKKQTDFLHYIGHIDEEGFECLDGKLDVSQINRTGTDTFLLNGCSSYQQAVDLIDAGAIAGIATLKPVLNSGAERVGRAIARLLNLGFSLISTLNIAKYQSIMGDNYVVIGDGSLNLTQPKSGIPSACEVSKLSDSYSLVYKTYLTRKRNMGTMTIPFVGDNKQYFLASGDTGEFKIDINNLLRFLSEEELPVQKNSTLYWSNEISIDDLTS